MSAHPNPRQPSALADLLQVSFVLLVIALAVMTVGLAAWQVVIRMLGLA